MKIKKIAVVGASGRMGQEIALVLKELKIKGRAIIRKEKAANYSENMKLKKESFLDVDLVVDFSSPASCLRSAELASELGIPFVSGTTGLQKTDFTKLKKLSRKIPILWSPNMSLGVATLKKALSVFEKLNNFDFQIEEIHHNKKKDAPSGTAILLQERLKKVVRKKIPAPLSIRAGGVIGTHRVYAISAEEQICFEHQAINRKVFASGAIQLSFWLSSKGPGYYSVEDLLG